MKEQLARRAWLALWNGMRRYHRYSVRGFEYLEKPGAALLVGYHARGTAFDLCMLTTLIHQRLGYLPHGIIHGFYGAQPQLKQLIDALGFVTGDSRELDEAVARGEHILVQPGGTREGCRSFAVRNQVDWNGRLGYLRLAIKHRLKIIPIAGRGLDRGFIGLNDGHALGRKLGLPHQLPLWAGLGPLGLWPFSPPFPVKVEQRIGAPIDPFAEGEIDLEDREALQRLDARVRGAVQALLEDRKPATENLNVSSHSDFSLGRELLRSATYPATGAWIRERRWKREPQERMDGQLALVTGGSRGLGFGIARGLAQRGAAVILVCRDRARGEEACRSLRSELAGARVELELADLSELRSIAALAARIQSRHARLDALVHNAGGIFAREEKTGEGHERTFATNLLGPFALTQALLSLLEAARGRVVLVGSSAQFLQRLDLEALVSPPLPYDGERAYAQSKRALFELGREAARRFAERGVSVATMHPGLTATAGTAREFPLYDRAFSPLLRDLDQGADTAIWLAARSRVCDRDDALWFDREPHPGDLLERTRSSDAAREALWNRCTELVRAASAPLELSRASIAEELAS